MTVTKVRVGTAIIAAIASCFAYYGTSHADTAPTVDVTYVDYTNEGQSNSPVDCRYRCQLERCGQQRCRYQCYRPQACEQQNSDSEG